MLAVLRLTDCVFSRSAGSLLQIHWFRRFYQLFHIVSEFPFQFG